jgi:transcriptional regulator with XRE-family HTH domain
MDDGTRIGAQIQRFRELAGLSKSDLARRVGVSPTAVNNWEANGVMPRLEVLIALQDVLEVDIIQLMTGSASAAPQATQPDASGRQPEISRRDRLDQFRRQIGALFEVPPDRVEIIIRP